MKIDLTRRDVLKFGAGAAAGVAMTPAPWKAIDDLAIWTQNWKWIPVPPKGPVSTKPVTCSLCPAGCPLSARCIGGTPVSMRPASRETAAALCPLGMTGHHLPFHPSRVTRPTRLARNRTLLRRVPVSLEAVLDESARMAKTGPVAVLDTRNGRSASLAWRRWLAGIHGGVFVVPPAREGGALATLTAMTGLNPDSTALDLTAARTIVSFGAPLAEGWGDPLMSRRIIRNEDEGLRLIQIEPNRSATAAVAGRWIPLLPGTETTLALGLANVLISNGLVKAEAAAGIADFEEYKALVAGCSAAEVAKVTGVPAEVIVATAEEIAANAPTVVVAGEDPAGGRFDRPAEVAILGLNLLLGNGGMPAGLVAREELPPPFDGAGLAPVRELEEIPDHSISLLIVDASEGNTLVPWQAVERKLVRDDSLVVAFSPFLTGIASRANYVVPTASFLETIHEIPSPFHSPRPTLALSGALVAPRVQAVDPMAFLHSLAGIGATGSEELIRARVQRIHANGAGTVVSAYDGTSKPLAELTSADELWEALLAGGRWYGEPSPPAPLRSATLMPRGAAELRMASTDESHRGLQLCAFAPRDVAASAAVSPLLTKIYQESGLRRRSGVVVVNPQTARQLRIADGRTVKVQTAAGALLAILQTDESVMPGVVHAAAGPDAAALGVETKDCGGAIVDILPGAASWRSVGVSVVEA